MLSLEKYRTRVHKNIADVAIEICFFFRIRHKTNIMCCAASPLFIHPKPKCS